MRVAKSTQPNQLRAFTQVSELPPPAAAVAVFILASHEGLGKTLAIMTSGMPPSADLTPRAPDPGLTTAGARRLGLILLIGALGLVSARAEFRLWTGKNGTSLNAELVSETATIVVLKKSDGTSVIIAKENLADADLNYLKTIRRPKSPGADPLALQPAQTADSSEGLRKALVFANTNPPQDCILKKVPLVTQTGLYCVPASAEMIATYHKVRVNQAQIARFSSNDSKNNKGTYTEDMANAMENLGFLFEIKRWQWTPRNRREALPAEVRTEIFPFIFAAITQCGPLYTSFKPGVFGDMGHGCVLIGYDQKKELFYFHNPWGNKFTKTFTEFAQEAGDVVAFQKPPALTGDGRALADKLAAALPAISAGMSPAQAVTALKEHNLPASLQLCGRRDQQDQRGSTASWGVSQDNRIINAALRTNLVVLMPAANEKGDIEEWVMLYHDPDPDNPQLLARRSQRTGWKKESPVWISELTSRWAALIGTKHWDLPLIIIGTAPAESTPPAS